MKKCTQEYRERSIRLTLSRTRRRIIRDTVPRHRHRKVGYHGLETIIAPRVFDLSDIKYRRKLIKMIHTMRHLAFVKHIGFNINFNRTESMVAPATLLFTAELRNIVSSVGDKIKILCTKPISVKVNEVLFQIGIYKLLKIESLITPKHETVVNWKFTCGTNIDMRKFDDVVKENDHRIIDSLSQKFFRIVSEAITNTIDHAYMNNRSERRNILIEKESWWMFSQVRGQRLTLVVCDLGVGVPGSLPDLHPSLWEKVKSVLGSTPHNGKVIKMVIENSISRTKLGHRGKGFTDMVNVTGSQPDSELLVSSNSGWYFLKHGQKPIVKDFGNSTNGTIIMFVTPIEMEASNGEDNN